MNLNLKEEVNINDIYINEYDNSSFKEEALNNKNDKYMSELSEEALNLLFNPFLLFI